MTLKHERMLRKNEVAAMFGLCIQTITRLVREGKFPRPVRVGRSVRWRESVIQAFIDAGGTGQRRGRK